jgi:hypothetical protein
MAPASADLVGSLIEDYMSRALIYALGLCIVSVALEGVFAGSGIKRRLAELRVPRFAPPLWGWIVIGLCYYVICFVVLFRLFSLHPASGLQQRAPLALLGDADKRFLELFLFPDTQFAPCLFDWHSI